MEQPISENKSLYVISDNFLSSLKMLSEAVNTEFENEEEKEKFLNEIVEHIAGREMELKKKAKGVKEFLEFCEHEVEILRGFKKDADKKISVIENTAKRLKNYCVEIIKKLPLLEIGEVGAKLSVVKNGGALPLEILEEDRIPFEYKKYFFEIDGEHYLTVQKTLDSLAITAEVESKTNVTKIKDALAKGKKINGVKLGERTERLKIGV